MGTMAAGGGRREINSCFTEEERRISSDGGETQRTEEGDETIQAAEKAFSRSHRNYSSTLIFLIEISK